MGHGVVAGGAADWGAYKPGQEFHDADAGVTIAVDAASASGDVVTVTKS